jgi:hypothetical protein
MRPDLGGLPVKLLKICSELHKHWCAILGLNQSTPSKCFQFDIKHANQRGIRFADWVAVRGRR